MKHKHFSKNGGFHIAMMVPYEVIGFGSIVLFKPFVGFALAAVSAVALVVAYHYVYRFIVFVARNVPTALGYSDLAAHKTKKTAAKVNAATKTQKLAQKTA